MRYPPLTYQDTLLFRQWRSFATVAEEGSVILAAARLRLAQPALTRQMQSLEREVGTRLLVRGHRGSTLTEAGAAFLADVRIIFGELDRMLARVQLAAQGRIGTVRIGLSRGAMDSEVLRRGLTALNRVLPDVRVVVTELADGQQVHELRMRAIDVAIGAAPRRLHDLMSAPLLDLELRSVVVPAGHRLAARESIPLHDLAGEPLLLVDSGPEDGPSSVVDQLRAHGFSASETLLSAESVHSSVAAGKGWTLASADTHPPTGAVVRPLAGASFTEKIEARWRAGDQSPVVAATVAALREAMGGPVAAVDDATGVAPVSGAPLELRHLEAVVATAELRSVTHAAQRLSLTQSGLTRRLQMAEAAAGVTLLRRSSAGGETTPAGEVFREGAARILSLANEAITRARTIGEGIAGR
jgi:DNA-binding transcriptional LysR family regulator